MEPMDAKFYLRKRYLVGTFMFFGVMITCVMKVDINIVLVDLTHPKSVFEGNETIIQVISSFHDLKVQLNTRVSERINRSLITRNLQKLIGIPSKLDSWWE